IVIHELFHFAWLRLGNARRASWEALVAREMERRARGELGWSAESRKNRITARDRGNQSRLWREYLCESFCDTAAWMFAAEVRHDEYTLAGRHRAARRAWFDARIGAGPIHL